MSVKFSFENIHKNKKWAFLDGLLCGLVSAGFAFYIWKDEFNDESDRKERAIYKQGYNDAVKYSRFEGVDKIEYI